MARLIRFLPALAVLVLTSSSVLEVVSLGQWPAVICCVSWAVLRLSRRETCLLSEVFWSALGLSFIVGAARAIDSNQLPSLGEVTLWAVSMAVLWIFTLTQTEPGPDPEHLRTEPVTGPAL